MSEESRVCTSCGTRVPKRQIHKNRYSQYICRQCRASGVKAVGQKNIRYLASRVPRVALGVIATLVVIVVLVVLGVSESAPRSDSGGGSVSHEAKGFKGVVRSLNKLAH